MTSKYNNLPNLQVRQPLVRPVHFRSINVASHQTANIRWASSDAVNFMDHLYFITQTVLDYLLENDLPQELMNQTLLNNPVAVLQEHRNELIQHFHKLIIAACTCLCIGISIPLFGFMIACCWCSGSSSNKAKRAPGDSYPANRAVSHSSRSRHNNRDSDSDWLALAGRDYNRNGDSSSSRHHRDADHRRRRHGRGHGRRSGASSSHHRSRSAPPAFKFETGCHSCLRTFFSSNLFVILLLVSFFVVCAFVTNEYVDNGVKQMPRALNQSIDELQVYLNNTDYEVDNLFRANFNQLENEINLRLDTSGMIIRHKLAVSSEAIALVNLTDIVAEFNDTKFRLERIDKELSSLRSKLHTAKIGFAKFRDRIENCPPDQCSLLRRKYPNPQNFRILPQYESLPDVKHLIKTVNQLIESGIIAQVTRGKDDMDKFALYIQREVNGSTPEIKTNLAALGRKFSNLASDVSHSIRWSDRLFNQTRSSTRKLNQFAEYEQYRRYACLGAAGVLLFILLCYTFGWLYGACRLQPTVRTYKTRVKTSASASFPFSCGIFTVFLVFLPMILAAIVLFLTGSVGDKIVCRVIKHPEQRQSKQIYAMLQNKFLGANLSISSPDEDRVTVEQIEGVSYKIYRPNYADLIARCHQNQSIYKIFKLDQYDKVYLTDDVGNARRVSFGLDKNFNIQSTLDFQRLNGIDERLRNLIKHVDLDTSRIQLLSPQAENLLKNSMSLSFDDLEMAFARLYDNGVAISPIDIEQLVKDFQAQKATVNIADLESELFLASVLATSFNEQLIPNITNSLLNLKEGVRHLKLRMFHGRNSFGSVIGELVAKVRSAEKQLRSDGKTLMRDSANEFIKELIALLDQYAVHVRNQVENVIGQCEPVSRALNSTTTTLCDDIILPFNGYWLSAIASLILILPATFLAYALRGLYKLLRRGGAHHSHHQNSYIYADIDDEVSYEDDGEEIALAYHLAHHNHMLQKPSGSSAPSAPAATEDGWPSGSYAHNTRPPPYAV